MRAITKSRFKASVKSGADSNRACARRFFATAFSVVLAAGLLGCAKRTPEAWTSPATNESLAKLEAKTLEPGISKKARARLFFLWGQELAAKIGGDSSKTDYGALAIGAFERVVDLDSILVEESRFNLEILWRMRNQGGSGQSDQADKDQNGDQTKNSDQSGSRNSQGQRDTQDSPDAQSSRNAQRQDDGKDSRGKGAGTKNPEDQNDAIAQSATQRGNDAGEPKDLSALVRDKDKTSELDSALQAELDRRSNSQTMRGGENVPVEKDW